MGLIRDLSNVDRSVFGKNLSRYKEERKKAQEDIALRAQRATKTQSERRAQDDDYRRNRSEARYDKASRLAELRARNERERAQYDKYSRPKAANVRRAPVKNAASDVGGSTSDELTLAQIAGQMESAVPSPRNAPPGLGQTDIVRGTSKYNPQKGDISIQGSFDPARIDSIISGVRDSVKGLGSQGAAIDAANNERDISGVLGLLQSFGIGTGPDAMENLRAEREMDPVIDYNDQALMDQRMANYAAMNAAASANSPSYKDLLATFGFNPGGSKSLEDQYSDFLGGDPTAPVMGPSPNFSSSPKGNGSTLKDQYTDFLMGPSPDQRVQLPGTSSYPEGYGSALNAPAGTSFTMQFMDKDGDGVDDRYQAGPGKPKRKAGSNFVGPSPYMV
jgi:hypothetical protein